jgi:hypothetical protein
VLFPRRIHDRQGVLIMATSTFAINAQGQRSDHAISPIHEHPEPLPAIKPLSRSTSYSFNSNAGQSRATARSGPSSPIDTVGNSRHTFEDSHVLGYSMRGKTQARPRGESDLGKPSPLRPLSNGFTAFAPVPEAPITTSKTRYVMICMVFE